MSSNGIKVIEMAITKERLMSAIADSTWWRAAGFISPSESVIGVSLDPNVILQACDGKTIPLSLEIEKKEVMIKRGNGKKG
jgi:hypothetical protein